MKKFNARFAFLFIALILLYTSCTKDLNRKPYYGINSALVYSDPSNYINLLAKLYAGFAATGQLGGDGGENDLNTGNQGYSQYIRELWNLEELTTDEAFWTYNDPDIYQLHNMTWTSLNQWITYSYDRIIYEVTLCNSFINNCSDVNLKANNITGSTATTIREYRAQARFLKALALSHGMDLFGNMPNVTDETKFPGGSIPVQMSRTDLFNYIETELLAIQSVINAPHANPYGQADQACVWSLLAHIYLNAQVYTGTARYSDAITYCNKVISAGYILSPSYGDLFRSDNNSSAAAKEIIFPINFDGLQTTTFGGTTYLTQAPIDNTPTTIALWKDVVKNIGMDGSFHRCLHTTSSFINFFNDQGGFADTLDSRYMFFNQGLTLSIDSFNIPTPNNNKGWTIIKFKNISSIGDPGPSTTFSSADYPMFRLGDIYLIYAEAVLRGGSGGNSGTALTYVNKLRERAFGNSSRDLTSLDLDQLFNERSREMQWEGTRRTDLIRFGKYTGGSYIWPWKGNLAGGRAVSDDFQLFPIPNTDIIANPNLHQNSGY